MPRLHLDSHKPMPRDEGGWRVAPAPDGRGMPDFSPSPGPHRSRAFLYVVLILLALNWGSVLLLQPGGEPRVNVPFSPYFLHEVAGNQVLSISSKGDTVNGTLGAAARIPSSVRHTAVPTRLFSTQVPTFADNNQLSQLLEAHAVQINATSTESSTPLGVSLLLGFGPTLLLVGLFVLFARRAAKSGGGMGALGAFGRSQARRIDPATIRVMFDDVAGIDESKAELTEIVGFLRDPGRYQRLGGRMPHGVLLSGAPGTGKTLLALAVAGEAHAAFFSISASEFIEAIVGVGAARVRDLFVKAREAAPAIIFIDELDAIGRSRAGSVALSGSNDEREQTLNQILTEMDGFEPVEAVVVLAATSRPEILDAALLRPGRFDRRVAVPAPDRAGRSRILQVHTRSIPLGSDVDFEALAPSTPGIVRADLANLCNEAALLATRLDHQDVHMRDFTDSLEKILLGSRRGIVLSPIDRERTAFHEAGHALVGMLTPGADPVRKISIIPRGLALGVTLSVPDDDRVSYTREDLLARIKVALGGRVAEELVYDTVTTGAESDLQQLTQIARSMVGRWGMSEGLGLATLLPAEGQGPFLPGASETSDETKRLLDEEVRHLIHNAHQEVVELLSQHRADLDRLTAALVEAETLDQHDAYAAAGVAQASEPLSRTERVSVPVA